MDRLSELMVLVVAILLLTLVGVTLYFYLTGVFRTSNIPKKTVKQDTILRETQNNHRQQSAILLLTSEKIDVKPLAGPPD